MERFKGLAENRPVKIAVLCVLALLAAVSVIAGVKNAVWYSQDFQWDASKAVCLRLDPYELSLEPEKALDHPELERFYRMFTDRGLKQKMEANQFPSLLVLLAPMTVFSPETAKIVWMILNLLFTAGIVILLRKTFFEHTDPYVFAALSLIMLAGTPYRNQLGVGQHTLFSFFFFMLAVYFDKKDDEAHKASNSVMISLCLFVSYFKYTLTAPLALYFLYLKRYREFAASVAAHVVVTEIAALWLGKSFIYMIKAPLQVASALTAEGGIDLGVMLGSASYVAAFVIALILTVMAVRFPKGSDRVLFSVLVLWSLVLTYHRTYDFFVLSVVSLLFIPEAANVFGKKEAGVFEIWYCILILSVYFGFRIFNENTPSKIVIGICYYAFAIAVTYKSGKLMIKQRTGKEDNG